MDNIKAKDECIKLLLKCFPKSFINNQYEFIGDIKTNSYFMLENCNNELDIKCKVLEWFSRAAFKTEPFDSQFKNEEHQDNIRRYINKFLGTNFSREEMEEIYTRLGNAVHHDLTIKFVKSNYDLELL